MILMMGKILNRLNSINDYSKKIIVYASMLCLVLCISGISLLLYDSNISHSFELHNIGCSTIHAGIVLFAQFIIGSLIIDFFNTLINSHNDE